MTFGDTSTFRFSFEQYNLFYTIQKHEICPFMETVPYDKHILPALRVAIVIPRSSSFVKSDTVCALCIQPLFTFLYANDTYFTH